MEVLVIQSDVEIYASKAGLTKSLSKVTQNFFKEKNIKVNLTSLNEGYDVDEEIAKLKKSDLIIYHFPFHWFGVPYPLKEYFDKVLKHKETFVGSEIYGEGGQLKNKSFMIAITSNMSKKDLEIAPLLKDFDTIDDFLSQVIVTNKYIGVDKMFKTFWADDVISGESSKKEEEYKKHLEENFTFDSN